MQNNQMLIVRLFLFMYQLCLFSINICTAPKVNSMFYGLFVTFCSFHKYAIHGIIATIYYFTFLYLSREFEYL